MRGNADWPAVHKTARYCQLGLHNMPTYEAHAVYPIGIHHVSCGVSRFDYAHMRSMR